MKKPILFSAPMVRALLDGSKTQTRRIVKPPKFYRWLNMDDGTMVNVGGHKKHISDLPSPYEQPGDQLWVREAWAAETEFDAIAPKDLRIGQRIYYPADRYISMDTKWHTLEPRKTELCPEYWRVRPSIHMPRWVSRITLEITDVRVERLHEITPADCVCEGYFSPPGTRYASEELNALDWYRTLWNSINGTDAWDENPWVWVISFRMILNEQ